MNYKKDYKYWLERTIDDQKTYDELVEIENNENEIKERFYKNLEFGTGGLRGILGAGTNRMNEYTVGRATQGLADFIKAEGKQKEGVVISYDCRHFSEEFALRAAGVLVANGIRTYVFDKMNPTPILSFAVRHLKTFMGIMITASHNPADYNGFKVYGSDGAQLNVLASNEVIKIINKLDVFKDVVYMSSEETKKSELFKFVGDDLVEEFEKVALAHQVRRSADTKNLKIVYTPFHGTGLIPVTDVLRKAGYDNVFVVEKQAIKDPDFSTVKSPNPEEKEGFYLAIDIAEKENADIIIGTDPDADRIGVLVKKPDGSYEPISGNQIGVLLADYILGAKSKKGELSPDDYVVSTIVTTNLIGELSKAYGVQFYKVFTGFKFIAEIIKMKEETSKGNFIFGFEESYGYLPGTYARDKDSVTTALLICEMAASLKERGKTISDALDSIYKRFGYYTEKTASVYMHGISGMEDMKRLMEKVRENPMKEIGSIKLSALNDYKKSLRLDFDTGEQAPIEMDSADVLIFEIEGGGFFALRPSGTEPKMKFYYSVVAESEKAGKEKIEYIDREVKKLLNL
ncbi:MAG: phospho-sugar mutase [Ruminococcaceae bacterium]|nr:phospho-sugar mutase [Oscillospiraceae bacterium]